jgi:hypothetical protein
MRERLCVRLNEIPGVTIPMDKLETWPTMPLNTLCRAEPLRQFLDTWYWYIGLVAPNPHSDPL